MNKLVLSLFIFLVGSIVNAQRIGNPGAGVERNGEFLTFNSAGIRIPVAPSTSPADALDRLPELRELLSWISSATHLTVQAKDRLLRHLIPGQRRTYIDAAPQGLSPQVEARILAQYARAANVPVRELRLFALTDTTQGTTYLLPSYRRLQTLPQKWAALIHEAFWMTKPNGNYEEAIRIEMAFERLITNPQNPAQPIPPNTPLDPAVLIEIYKVFSESDIPDLAVRTDLATGALHGLLVDQTKISLETLFGPSAINCFRTNLSGYGMSCIDHARLNISLLARQFPRSLVLRQYMNMDTIRGTLLNRTPNPMSMIFGGSYYLDTRQSNIFDDLKNGLTCSIDLNKQYNLISCGWSNEHHMIINQR